MLAKTTRSLRYDFFLNLLLFSLAFSSSSKKFAPTAFKLFLSINRTTFFPHFLILWLTTTNNNAYTYALIFYFMTLILIFTARWYLPLLNKNNQVKSVCASWSSNVQFSNNKSMTVLLQDLLQIIKNTSAQKYSAFIISTIEGVIVSLLYCETFKSYKRDKCVKLQLRRHLFKKKKNALNISELDCKQGAMYHL